MSETLTKDQWIDRVLGVSYVRPTTGRSSKKVRFAPVPTTIPPPNGGGIQLGRERSGAMIRPKPKGGSQDFTGEGGKKITITKGTDGKVSYTTPPPQVKEITFSGGGAKGAALPGAIQALQESGVLKDATKIAGASVGSMTAALVAAGITAEEFTKIANSDETTDKIVEGSGGTKLGLLGAAMKNKFKGKGGNPLTGQGLEDVVKGVLDDTVRTRIEEYLKKTRKDGGTPDQTVVDRAKLMSERQTGPTFMDFRVLSKFIPAIKEVVITGTYTTEWSQDFDGNVKKRDNKGQLYVFDADSEPDLPISVAVHASASFPVAFKPVDIKLSSGAKVRFIDGGVMNNTPTSSSIGAKRDLDPMPDSRGMTFVFEDPGGESGQLLKGTTSTPSDKLGTRGVDWFLGSDHSGAEYAKNRDMTDRPEDIVVVPLQVTLPPKKPGGKPQHIDMRDGTLNFGLSLDAKLQLQTLTKEATKAHIDREKADKTREFASDSQMFMSIPMADLKALGDNGYEGAKEAYTVRERVAEMIDKLQDAVTKQRKTGGGHTADLLKDQNVSMAIDELDKLAAGDIDVQGYIGREMNKSGDLDLLIEEIRKGKRGGDTMKVTGAVSDAVRAHDFADNILKQLVYPQMKQQPKGGSGIETLLIMEGLLRAAKTPDDVNEAITIGVKHFSKKADNRVPRRGHKQFAKDLEQRMMKKAA